MWESKRVVIASASALKRYGLKLNVGSESVSAALRDQSSLIRVITERNVNLSGSLYHVDIYWHAYTKFQSWMSHYIYPSSVLRHF